MRTAYITTKIRPIRKLFIVEPNNFESFKEILIDIANDIELIFNIFLEDNEQLSSLIIQEFVKRHAPDLIFNLSKRDNNEIEHIFNIQCITPDSVMTRITRFCTYISFISNTPALIQKYSKSSNDSDIFCAETINTNDILSIISCINFGLYSHDEEDRDLFSNSAFQDINIQKIDSTDTLKECLSEKKESFNRLYNQINPFTSGYGSSIWDIDYSHPNYFQTGQHIFISSCDDLAGIFFFWNMRATYPQGNFFWLAEEALDEFSSSISSATILIAFNENIQNKIKQLELKNEIFIPDRLYFHGTSTGWKFFTHEQTINILNNESIVISHPLEKSFSELGMGGACIFEVQGMKEFWYPNHSHLGLLFEPKNFNKEMFSERFTHLYNNKLIKYHLQFNPMEMSGLTIEFRIPNFKEAIESIFHTQHYILKQTDKSSILNQLVKILGGIAQIKTICDESISNLLIKMTPKSRIEKKEKFIQEINNGTIELSPVIRSFKDITSLANNKDKIYIKNILQQLHDKKLLLRGKHFTCKHCASNIWIPIENIARVNYCIACNNEVDIPIVEEDKFRLNQLLIKAIDQGQLSTLVLLNFFVQNSGRDLNFLSNQEVYQKSKSNTPITDIDLIVKIGNKIDFAECKSTSPFDEKQIDELIKISTQMKCDFMILSSLVCKDEPSIKETINYVNSKNFNIPLFIFTKEVLFNQASVDLYSFFEKKNNQFQKGVFLLANNMKTINI